METINELQQTQLSHQQLAESEVDPNNPPVPFKHEPKEWDADMELALLNAIARCKPVGIHKHFRMISIQKQFNKVSPISCSLNEIWDKLSEFYGMIALDELEEEDEEQEEEEREEQDKRREEAENEFSLPLEDYEQLISEHRQNHDDLEEEEEGGGGGGREEEEQQQQQQQQQEEEEEEEEDIQSTSTSATPNSSALSPPPAKRTRFNKRDTSPAYDSVTSTPEPEEGNGNRVLQEEPPELEKQMIPQQHLVVPQEVVDQQQQQRQQQQHQEGPNRQVVIGKEQPQSVNKKPFNNEIQGHFDQNCFELFSLVGSLQQLGIPKNK
ncbi:chromatin modification-related protein EAF7-domain-containing protein [Mycotypha africana]|uniref:chromatin modification-related protein EAF7-domain-containing protein n=1 Tax=Mycotypha africana TaxID=64632 RepID=UPI002300555C|nr:chromatin modification-related protein EAF7-domain-containing protein [Mycotypha africana]KAI8970060.1 chromatin modification-related protein EAF7-domain-containing protein [Mycotypha africana]